MDTLNRPYRRDRTTAVAYVFNSALTGFQVALGAIMPIIRDDLGISLTLASLHFMLMSLCGLGSSLRAAEVARRFGRRATTIGSLTVSLLGMLVFCLGPSVAFTLTGAALLGLAGPFGVILSQAELMDRHPAHRAVALADLSLVVSVAMLATVLGSGPLASLTDSWRLALGLPAIALASGLVVIRRLQFTDAGLRDRLKTPRRMNGLAWLFCVVVVSQAAFEWCFGYLGAEFMDKVGGLSKESAASSMALYYTGLVTGRVVLVPLVRRLSSYVLLMTSFSVALVGFAVMAGGPTTGIKLAGLFLSGLGISFTFPMISSLAGSAFPDATDWIVSRLYVAGGLSIAIAPFVIGTLGDQIGIARSFWVVGVIGAVGLVAGPVLRRMLAANDDATPVAAADQVGA